ncbi:MAG: SPOR domain-containing protein, partial [Gammaproteobacteria bacterium]
MPRDYKPSARKRRQSSRAKPSSRWPWLFGGLAAGVLVSYAAYFLTMRAVPDTPKQAAQKPASKPAPQAAKPPEEGIGAREKSRFDFYTLLPEMEVKITNDALNAARGGSSPKPEHKGPYILQVGSFRSYGEADNLKARLALIGVEASIQTVIISDDDT